MHAARTRGTPALLRLAITVPFEAVEPAPIASPAPTAPRTAAPATIAILPVESVAAIPTVAPIPAVLPGAEGASLLRRALGSIRAVAVPLTGGLPLVPRGLDLA